MDYIIADFSQSLSMLLQEFFPMLFKTLEKNVIFSAFWGFGVDFWAVNGV